MKIDSSLMFDPVKVGEIAGQLEDAGFDGAYTFEGQSDPFISVAAAAMNTKQMDLMTSIAVAFSRLMPCPVSETTNATFSPSSRIRSVIVRPLAFLSSTASFAFLIRLTRI